MRPNHEYWCKCTWRTNGINKTDLTSGINSDRQVTSGINKWQTWPPLTVGLPVTSERYWASFQVTRLFHKVTVSQCDHFVFVATYVFVAWNFTRLITRLKSFFFLILTSIWWGSTQLQCIYYLRRILISRPPRVFRRFKRRSCFSCDQAALWMVQSVCASVHLSVCDTFFTMFLTSYHHEIFRSYYHWQKWCPCERSRSRSQRSWPHLAVSGL